MMVIPSPTPIYRIIHIDNLPIYLQRNGGHAPNNTPNDGLIYKTIHNTDIQQKRQITPILCGPGGTIHDYVSFYFGPRSPMLFQLHTGWVPNYSEGQEPIIYLVSNAQAVHDSEAGYVFSDGHGIIALTNWFDDPDDLNQVDWNTVNLRYWADDVDDMDRKRRKQAEFLVHEFCDWSLIETLAVINKKMRTRVEEIMDGFSRNVCREVVIKRNWYY